MTTTVTHSIGLVSKDYSLYSTWWADCPANLTSVDQIWKGEAYDQIPYPGATTTFSGVTADSTRYPWLTAAAGCSLRDDPTAPLRYNGSMAGMFGNPGYAQSFIDVANSYMRVDGLQFSTSAGGTSSCVRLTGVGGVRFVGNLVDTTYAGYGIAVQNSDAIVANNVVVQHTSGGGRSIQCFGNFNPVIIGNSLLSLIGTEFGIAASSGYVVPLCLNNAIFGHITAMSGSNGFGASDYNCSDSATLGGSGTHQLTSRSVTQQFRNAVAYSSLDLRPLTSGSDIAGAGTNPTPYAGNNLDYYGATRASPPTIGAADLGVAAGGGFRGRLYYDLLGMRGF